MSRFASHPAIPLPDDCNPGIIRTAEFLTEAGYRITDSGDGETHDHVCDRDHGYLVVVVPASGLVQACDEIVNLLRGIGLTPAPASMETPPAGEVWVQGTYFPIEGVATIDIAHIHDRMWGDRPAPMLERRAEAL